MAEKKTILIHPVSGEEFTLEAEHAERVLNMGHGWKAKTSVTAQKKTKSAGKKRDTKATGSKAQQDDDCGCSQS